jgi:hypothetical protein
MKAKRICLGYQDSLDLHFKPYHATSNSLSSHTSVISLNMLKESSSWEDPEGLTQGDTDARIECHALSAFFYDYCLAPQSGVPSHGYLDGLEALLKVSGPSSDLARATKAVALASIGTKLRRPSIIHNARIVYSGLLQSLQVKITNEILTGSTESLMTVVLLGLYEVCIFITEEWYTSRSYRLTASQIITATETHPSNHGSHSRGVYAMLPTQKSSIELLDWVKCCQVFIHFYVAYGSRW